MVSKSQSTRLFLRSLEVVFKMLLCLVSVTDKLTAYELKKYLFEKRIAKHVSIYTNIDAVYLNDSRYMIDGFTVMAIKIEKQNYRKMKELIKDQLEEKFFDINFINEINDNLDDNFGVDDEGITDL